MSNTNNNTTNIEDLSREDLLRIFRRDQFVKEQLVARVASLVHENIEMLGLVQELQQSLGQYQGQSNGEVTTTPAPSVDVTS